MGLLRTVENSYEKNTVCQKISQEFFIRNVLYGKTFLLKEDCFTTRKTHEDQKKAQAEKRISIKRLATRIRRSFKDKKKCSANRKRFLEIEDNTNRQERLEGMKNLTRVVVQL